MISIRANTLSDLARHGYQLRVECKACKHRALLEPVKLMLTCQERHWPRDLDALARKMKCSKCQSRDVTCGPG